MKRQLRMALSIAIAMIAAGTSLVATSGTASADSVQVFHNGQSGFCLDDSDDGNHFGLRVFPCNGTSYQQWNVHVWEDDTRQLKNVATQRCIGGVQDRSNAQLTLGPCTSSEEMSWRIGYVPDGGIRFIPQAAGNFCLADYGGNYAGGHYVGAEACMGAYYPSETVWH